MFSTAGVLTLTLALGAAQSPTTPAPTPADDGERDQPLTRLFQNLGQDIIRLPSIESATIAAIGVGGALVAHPVDDNLRSWGDGLGSSSYTRIGQIGGAGWVHGTAAVATYVVGLATDHQPTVHVGSDLIRAQALNGVVTRVLKIAVHRKRPSGSSDSLPSGHTSASFATAAVLGGHYGWKVAAPAYAGAGFVAWTRVRDRAHWLSDVVIGATVGTIVGRSVTAGHRGRGWTVIPVVGRGSVGVMAVRVGWTGSETEK